MIIFNFLIFNEGTHCMRSACIRSFFDPYFPAFGLNTKRYSVNGIIIYIIIIIIIIIIISSLFTVDVS